MGGAFGRAGAAVMFGTAASAQVTVLSNASVI